MLPEQELQLCTTLGHNVEEVSSDGASIAECHEPDLASDGSRDSLFPEVAQIVPLIVMVPSWKNFPLPNWDRLLESDLLQ